MEKPFYVQAMEKNDPDLLAQMNSLHAFATKDGALPGKVKMLMAMLCDAILGHGEGVRALAQMARTQGATDAEIAETVRMAFAFAGMPGLVTGTFAYRA